MMGIDYPNVIGGKPYFPLPAFIPITFELTVFCAAHGMALTYFLRCWLIPGAKAKNPDPRTTDDKFVIELRTSENTKFSGEELVTMLKATGIVELDQKDI